MELPGTLIAKTIQKKNKAGRNRISSKTFKHITKLPLKTYYKGRVMNKVCYRHADQWNRIGSLETNLHISDEMIFDKGGKTMYQEKNLFNKWCWENWIFT